MSVAKLCYKNSAPNLNGLYYKVFHIFSWLYFCSHCWLLLSSNHWIVVIYVLQFFILHITIESLEKIQIYNWLYCSFSNEGWHFTVVLIEIGSRRGVGHRRIRCLKSLGWGHFRTFWQIHIKYMLSSSSIEKNFKYRVILVNQYWINFSSKQSKINLLTQSFWLHNNNIYKKIKYKICCWIL